MATRVTQILSSDQKKNCFREGGMSRLYILFDVGKGCALSLPLKFFLVVKFLRSRPRRS